MIESTARYYTTKTAAARLEVATVTVRMWCELGRLPAIKFGKLWKIPVAVVEDRITQAEKGRGELLTDARAA
jgi:excisionase family DNA binding protein